MPNDDLISRKALIEQIEEDAKHMMFTSHHSRMLHDDMVEFAVNAIEYAPAVDAEPVRRARLLSTGYDEAWCEWGDCTNCGMSNIIGSKRCCECGAYLEEER